MGMPPHNQSGAPKTEPEKEGTSPIPKKGLRPPRVVVGEGKDPPRAPQRGGGTPLSAIRRAGGCKKRSLKEVWGGLDQEAQLPHPPPPSPNPPSPSLPRCRFSPLRHDPRRLYRSPPPAPAPVRAPMAPPVTDTEPPPGPSSLRARRGRSRRALSAAAPPRPRHQRQRRRGQWGQRWGAGTSRGQAPFLRRDHALIQMRGGDEPPAGDDGRGRRMVFRVECACALGITVITGLRRTPVTTAVL